MALVLAACSPQNQEAAALAGEWEGDLQIAGTSVPVAFTIDARGEIEDSTFNLSFNGENFSYQVRSEVRNSQFWLDASATHADIGHASLSLTGLVGHDEISGEYVVSVNVRFDESEVRLEETGSFRIDRVHSAE